MPDGLDRRRFENKLNGDYAIASTTPDGIIQVQVFDRTGALKADLPDFAQMQMFLQQTYPIPDEDMIKAYNPNQARDWHGRFGSGQGDIPNEHPFMQASDGVERGAQHMLGEGANGFTVFHNDATGRVFDVDNASDRVALHQMLPKEDLFIIGRTNNTDLHSARASALHAPEDVITQMRSHAGFRATTTGGWRDQNNVYIDHGVLLSTDKSEAVAWGQKWGQKSVMELDNRGPDLKVNFHDVAKTEESYNVGSQGIPGGGYPPLAMMKPGYGGAPPDKPRSHEHFAGEFPGQGRKPAATTTMDTEAYQKLRSRGLNDAQSRHALLLMQSTGIPVEQLQMSGLMAVPQMEEGGPGSGRHKEQIISHYDTPEEAQQGMVRAKEAGYFENMRVIPNSVNLGGGKKKNVWSLVGTESQLGKDNPENPLANFGREEGRPVTSGAGTHGHYANDPEAQHSGRSRAGAALGIGGAAVGGIGGMAMAGQSMGGQHTPLPQMPKVTPATQLSGPKTQTLQQLQQQALMQARQSVGAPVTGRPNLRMPGMHGQAVISPTGLAQTTGKPIVPPHGMSTSGSPLPQGMYEEGNEGNETLNPDGTIETGRAGDAVRLLASFRKFGQKKVVDNGTK